MPKVSTPLASTANDLQPACPRQHHDRRLLLRVGGLMGGVFAVAGSLPVWANAERLVIGGSGSAVGGMRLVARAYAALPNARLAIEVLPAIGSRGSLRALADRRIDVALTNFLPPPELPDGTKVLAVEYARSPFFFAVKRGLVSRPLTSAEVAALFSPGARFPGGARARPVLRPGDDVDNELIGRLAPEIAQAMRDAAVRLGMLTAGTDSDAADLIEQTPGAFGATTLAQIVSEQRALEPLLIGNERPSVEALRNGSYGHFKRLVAVTRVPAAAPVQQLLDFLRSANGQAALASGGQLPV
jgi:phosphate transport system substrate-binding protein